MAKLRLDDILEAISKESQMVALSETSKISSGEPAMVSDGAKPVKNLTENLKKNLNLGNPSKTVPLKVVSTPKKQVLPVVAAEPDVAEEIIEKVSVFTLTDLPESNEVTQVNPDIWAEELLQASEGLSAKAKAMRMEPLYLEDFISDDDILILQDENIAKSSN